MHAVFRRKKILFNHTTPLIETRTYKEKKIDS